MRACKPSFHGMRAPAGRVPFVCPTSTSAAGRRGSVVCITGVGGPGTSRAVADPQHRRCGGSGRRAAAERLSGIDRFDGPHPRAWLFPPDRTREGVAIGCEETHRVSRVALHPHVQLSPGERQPGTDRRIAPDWRGREPDGLLACGGPPCGGLHEPRTPLPVWRVPAKTG
jgi:hypothetical protein